MPRRCILLVLDSVGIGALPDAIAYGDEGSDTLGHLCRAQRPSVPNLERLGLGCIRHLDGVQAAPAPRACFGKMMEISPGKDSTTGHWELSGVIIDKPFCTFPSGFPSELIKQFSQETGLEVLGNKAASGTEIIQALGQEHQISGKPIIYTSADPVLQIAAHEDIISVNRLYEICEIAFKLAVPFGISRVIARPFTGSYPDFKRTERRRDYTVPPPATTMLDILMEQSIPVVAIGKVDQIFAGRGVSMSYPSKSNQEGMDRTIAALGDLPCGLIFTNLVDFDMLYGHRRDVVGYTRALEEFDGRLPELLAALMADDLLLITADHGNDPTFDGTDHTREFVPLLAYGPSFVAGRSLGIRTTFSDVAATIASLFGLEWTGPGRSFLEELQT